MCGLRLCNERPRPAAVPTGRGLVTTRDVEAARRDRVINYPLPTWFQLQANLPRGTGDPRCGISIWSMSLARDARAMSAFTPIASKHWQRSETTLCAKNGRGSVMPVWSFMDSGHEANFSPRPIQNNSGLPPLAAAHRAQEHPTHRALHGAGARSV
jgi:hypothetical protein